MRGTQFGTTITEPGTGFDNSGNIPVCGNLIRNNTQLHFYLPIGSSQPLSVSKTKGQKLKVDEHIVPTASEDRTCTENVNAFEGSPPRHRK